jgi:hypothetical protein
MLVSIFDDDQVFFIEFVGQKWLDSEDQFEWFCSLKGTSARWIEMDVATRYDTAQDAIDSDTDGEGRDISDNLVAGNRAAIAAGAVDHTFGADVAMFRLTDFGRSDRMNIVNHIGSRSGHGWLKFRGNRGLVRMMSNSDVVPELDLESLAHTHARATGASMYPSFAYGARTYRPTKILTLAIKLYKKATAARRSGTGIMYAELMGHLESFRGLIAYLRTISLRGWRFEVSYDASGDKWKGQPIEPGWLDVIVFHQRKAMTWMFGTGRVDSRLDSQIKVVGQLEEVLRSISFEAAIMESGRQSPRVLHQVGNYLALHCYHCLPPNKTHSHSVTCTTLPLAVELAASCAECPLIC